MHEITIGRALRLLVMLATSACVASESEEYADVQRALNEASQQLADGNVEAAKRSVRIASRCDTVSDVRAVKPIGVRDEQQFQATLGVALKYLAEGYGWRATAMAQRMAGCQSLELDRETRESVRANRAARE